MVKAAPFVSQTALSSSDERKRRRRLLNWAAWNLAAAVAVQTEATAAAVAAKVQELVAAKVQELVTAQTQKVVMTLATTAAGALPADFARRKGRAFCRASTILANITLKQTFGRRLFWLSLGPRQRVVACHASTSLSRGPK
jgi:hypothetical protein